MLHASSTTLDSSSETESSDNAKSNKFPKQFSTTSSDGCESDVSSPRPAKPRSRFPRSYVRDGLSFREPNELIDGFHLFLRRKPKPSGRYWSGEISARSNQDNQREFEERAMKHIIAMVGRKTGSEMNTQQSNYHHGGTYVKLESEWRERLRHSKAKNNNTNNK